jgi:branched-chain amino acid transport system substrate-binding protein
MLEYKFEINKSNNHIKTICFLFLTIIAALNSCDLKPEKQEYITIGALLPLTGEDSDEGLRALNGLQIAREEINQNGGVLGKKVDIIVLNDRGDEEYVVQQYNALIKKGVIAIIGSSYSGVTLALAKEAEKDGFPIISPTASNPEVTKGRRNVFRAIFIDDYQAEVMAHFARGSLNAQTAVVMNNRNSSSFQRASGVFTKSFRDRGGRIMAVEPYSDGDDFADILGKYTAAPPDVIFCPENFLPAAKLVNSAYEIGLNNTYILGSDAWDGLLAYVYNQDAMINIFYSAPFSFDDKDANVSGFVRKYFESFSQIPLSGSAAAYTTVYILSEAIKKAAGTGKDAIVSAMKEIELDTITGRIKFDQDNNPRTNVYVIQIKGGEYTTYKKMSL